LPVLSKSRIQTKLLDIVKKLKSAKKRARKNKKEILTEKWMSKLIDVSACKCKRSSDLTVQFWNGKYACAYPFENCIPAKEFNFLIDQRNDKK